jgi:hypothetical protein
MLFRHIKRLLVSLLLVIAVSTAHAQLNTLAGYVNSQANFPVLDKIVGHFNTNTPRRQQNMPNLRNINGMELGLRYRVPYYGVEAGWSNRFARTRDRIQKPDSTTYQNTLMYKTQSFSVGNEFYYKWLGLGGTIDFNQMKVRQERTLDNKKEDVLTQTYWSSQVFLNFEFTFNDILAFSIRPYVQMPWKSINFFDLEKSLNPDRASSGNPDDFVQRPFYYGIRVIFANGARNDASRH